MIGRAAACLLALALAAGPASAQAPSRGGSALVRALADCRSLADDARRLACYDAAAGRLETAERAGEVVVVDREQARAARRQAFGFHLPSLDIFRGGDEPDLDRVSMTVASASLGDDGRLTLRMEDGQVWRQVDTRRLTPRPRAGSNAVVRRAALGSFFMNIDRERAIRVRREQ